MTHLQLPCLVDLRTTHRASTLSPMAQVQNVFQWQAQEAKDFFQLLGSMKDLMFALGISIQVPGGGSIAQRYRQVQDQIDELDPKEKQVFE